MSKVKVVLENNETYARMFKIAEVDIPNHDKAKWHVAGELVKDSDIPSTGETVEFINGISKINAVPNNGELPPNTIYCNKDNMATTSDGEALARYSEVNNDTKRELERIIEVIESMKYDLHQTDGEFLGLSQAISVIKTRLDKYGKQNR